MECKFYNNAYTVYLAQVLIETLWNVNEAVNASGSGVGVGINRNIVECKFLFVAKYYLQETVLIETLWNVNLYITEGNAEGVRY